RRRADPTMIRHMPGHMPMRAAVVMTVGSRRAPSRRRQPEAGPHFHFRTGVAPWSSGREDFSPRTAKPHLTKPSFFSKKDILFPTSDSSEPRAVGPPNSGRRRGGPPYSLE